MMRVCISAIIAMMAMSGGLVEGQDESSIKLELLYEKPFDDLYSTSEGFPPAEIQQILKRDDIPDEDKEWLLNSLRIEIARRKKLLYTNNGTVVQLPGNLKSIATSNNLKYIIVHDSYFDYADITPTDLKNLESERSRLGDLYHGWRERYNNADPNNKDAYSDSMRYWGKKFGVANEQLTIARNKVKQYDAIILMETENGMTLWKKDAWKYAYTGRGDDIILPQYISDDRKTIIAVSCIGSYKDTYTKIHFYDENGREKKTVTGLYGKRGCYDMSPDGMAFNILTRNSKNDTTGMIVKSFNQEGYELWATQIPGKWPPFNRCISVSPNSQYTVASVNETYLLDTNGRIIESYNCKTYLPKFSRDSQYLIIGTLRDTIYFVEAENGEIIWRKHLGGHSYKEPMVAQKGRVTFFISIENGQPSYLLDEKGNLIWQENDILTKAVGISPTGYFFVPTTNPSVKIYYLSSEVENEK
jgi:hypothetical protein